MQHQYETGHMQSNPVVQQSEAALHAVVSDVWFLPATINHEAGER